MRHALETSYNALLLTIGMSITKNVVGKRIGFSVQIVEEVPSRLELNQIFET